MCGYDDAQARQIFRDLIDMPTDVASLAMKSRSGSTAAPIVLASELIKYPSRPTVARPLPPHRVIRSPRNSCQVNAAPWECRLVSPSDIW
jgi:hypothetical protein